MHPHKQRYLIAIALCLTLGLAPFYPEPHLIGKWRWLLGGAVGMEAMDWFDLALHSAPFVFLLFLIIKDVGDAWQRGKREKQAQ